MTLPLSGDGSPRGSYDVARQLYNWKPTNTRTWRRGVARTLAGGAARINCYGPSTVAGYTYSGRSEWHAWPSYLRRLLAQRYGESGSGVIYFHEPDPRVQLWTSGWTPERYGPYGRSCWSAKTTDATLTFRTRATGFRVTYLSAPGAGLLSAVSDSGQLPTVVDCNGLYGVRTASLPAGNLGDHTLTVRPHTAGGIIFVIGVEAYVGPTSTWTSAGISVTNVGAGSTVAASLVYGDTKGIDTSLGASVDTNPADLSIVAFAENSPSYQLPEEMKADFRVLLNRIRSSGSDILLCTSIDWKGDAADLAMKADQSEYDAAVYELADEYDVPLFDIAKRWGLWADSPGYYADRIHPSPTGYADIAGGIAHVLGTGVW